MLTISLLSESVAVYAGDSSSSQLLDLTDASYCNLHGLAVVSGDGIQFNNHARVNEHLHQGAGAATLLFAAADGQSELRLIEQSVEGIEVRLIERNMIPAAIAYPAFVFAIDSYAITIEATSSGQPLASFFDAGEMPVAAPSDAALPATLQATPPQAAPLHTAVPMPTQPPSDDRFAAFYTLEPLHPTLPKPMGLAEFVRGPIDAASCGVLGDS